MENQIIDYIKTNFAKCIKKEEQLRISKTIKKYSETEQCSCLKQIIMIISLCPELRN